MSSFFAARTLEEALDAVARGFRPIAGGTDLVVQARAGKTRLPDHLVAIHRIAKLQRVTHTAEGGLHLGSMTTHAAVLADTTVQARFTALADACAIVGSHATRAQGTIGGNLMNASPAMETGGPLVCLGASIALASAGRTRALLLEELWEGPGQTVATPDELLVAIELPPPTASTGSAYQRLEYRRQMEIAVVGVTAVVTIENQTITAARVAMTALAPTVRRVTDAETALVGTAGDARAIAAAAVAVEVAARPISDVRGSADYRRAMAAVIAERVVATALGRAKETP